MQALARFTLPVLNVLGAVLSLFAFSMLVPLAFAYFGGDQALAAYDTAFLVTLASGPIGVGGNFPHDATIYETDDAFVFAASSILFARALHDHPELTRLMENVLDRAGAAPHAAVEK